jgi:hypothetical protein
MKNAVLAEREALAMAHNPFVVKLYYAFQSKVGIIFLFFFVLFEFSMLKDCSIG